MNDWMMWLMLAGIVVILELFSGTFYLLMVAIGMVVGGVAALCHLSSSWQMIIAAMVAALATLMLHKSRFGYRKARTSASKDPNVNLDIGQRLTVGQWQAQGDGHFVARAMYRGAEWDVELRHGEAHAGMYVIEEVQGSRLLVKPV